MANKSNRILNENKADDRNKTPLKEGKEPPKRPVIDRKSTKKDK